MKRSNPAVLRLAEGSERSATPPTGRLPVSVARYAISWRRWAALPGPLLAFLLVPAVFAADSDKAKAAQTKQEYSELSLEELLELNVFAASLYDQPVTQAPASVSIITSDQIRRYGYRTLAEVLDSVAGFYSTYDRNYDYAGVRGFGPPGDYNTRLLILIDGHRTNEAVYDFSYLGREFAIDLDLIERVEVVRGPSSSIYGTSAFFGVVNVITKKPQNLDGLWLSGSGASFSSFGGQLDYGGTLGEGRDILLSAEHYDSKGQSSLYFEEFDDPETNNGLAVGADDEQVSRFLGKLSLGSFTLEGAYSRREKGIPTAPWGTVFNDPRTRTIDEQTFVAMDYKRAFGNRLTLATNVTGSFVDYDGDYVYDYAEEEAESPSLVVNKDTARSKWLGGQVHVTKKFAGDHTLLLGAEYRNNFEQDQHNFDLETYLDDRRSSDIWAFFVQDQFSIGENLTFHLGVRHDQYDTFGGTTNPRLGVIYGPLPTTSLKFLFGRAFRAPNAYELYYNDGGISQKGNPELEPETIETYEVVVEHFFGSQIRASASLFKYRTENLIALEVDPEDQLLWYQNLDRVEAEGVEVEMVKKWPGGAEARGSYTVQSAEIAPGGERPVNSPGHLVKGNFAIPVFDRLLAGVEAKYASGRRTLLGNDADGAVVANVTLSNTWLKERIDVSASCYNVFDQRYYHPGSAEHVQNLIEQDGRTFRVVLRYRF